MLSDLASAGSFRRDSAREGFLHEPLDQITFTLRVLSAIQDG
jgi:hypothetical protein